MWGDVGELVSTDDGSTETVFTYDAQGRRTGADDGTTDRVYRYDARGKLAGADVIGGLVEDRSYSPAGDLVAMQVRDNEEELVTDASFLWDATQHPNQVVWAIDHVAEDWVRASYGVRRIAVEGGVWGPYFYSYDHLESAIEGTGTAPAPDSYGPFGTAVDPPAGVGFGYRGELTLDGLVHLRNRDYDPTTGTFTTRDPMGGVDGTPTVANPYHYADNDPLNKIDPMGTRPCDADFGNRDNANDLRYDAVERPDPVPGANSLREALKNEDRCLLFYDGRDNGMAGAVVGNLSAQHVMIELAATGTRLSNFTEFMGRAATIQAGSSDFAVIAYLGYSTPDGADAAWHNHGDPARDRLANLVKALKAKGKHVTLLAHSWAAQVAIDYDSQGAQNADDLIMVGAFDVDSLAAWDFASDREWEGRNEDDGVPGDWVEGARRFSTTGSAGHDYFTGEALTNIQRIGRGQFRDVTCAGGGDHCRWGF